MPSLPASNIVLLQPFAALFDVRTRQAHRVLGSAGAGSAGAAGFRPLPPCAQPGSVVVSGGEPGSCWACCCVIWPRPAGRWSWGSTKPWNGARASGLWPKGSIGMACVPRMVTSSRPWACAGSACCGWWRSPGRGGCGLCLSSPCWPPPAATMRSGAAVTRPSRTGPARCCAVCGVGCPTTTWWWWATGATQPCACWPPASA